MAKAQQRESMSKLAKREERTALWLLLPSFVVILLIAIYPLGRVFYSSFTNERFAPGVAHQTSFVGFRNFQQLLSVTIRELPPVIDEATGQQAIHPRTGLPQYESWVRVLPREPLRFTAVTEFDFLGRRYVLGATSASFIRAVWDTLVFTVANITLTTLLGMVVALTLATRFVGRGLMRAAMLIPWAIITVVSARIWEWMLHPTRAGLFNTLLSDLGLGDGNIAFLQIASLQMPAMVMIDVWKTTPFMALLFLAGLSTISQELYEAAEVDGAGKVRQFFSITLPLLAPTIAVALVFRTLDALRVFDLFQVVLGRQRFSMASYAQYLLIAGRDVGMSSAASVIIFLIILIFALFYMRALGVQRE